MTPTTTLEATGSATPPVRWGEQRMCHLRRVVLLRRPVLRFGLVYGRGQRVPGLLQPSGEHGSSNTMPSYACDKDEYISGGCTGTDTSDSVGFCAPCDMHGGSSKYGASTCTGTNMYIANRCTGAPTDTQ